MGWGRRVVLGFASCGRCVMITVVVMVGRQGDDQMSWRPIVLRLARGGSRMMVMMVAMMMMWRQGNN